MQRKVREWRLKLTCQNCGKTDLGWMELVDHVDKDHADVQQISISVSKEPNG